MRGKEYGKLVEIDGDRITPAYAGKSLFVYNLFPEFEDHPRLCGEKDGVAAEKTLPWGSPPPMRGKAFKNILVIMPRRITPAYAGKRRTRSESHFVRQDPPRLCGEKKLLDDTPTGTPGSPPPMRGKVPVRSAYA